MSGKIGVMALQGDVREHVSVLAELGAHPVEVRRPEDLAGIDGIIVPGGESTTMALLLDSAGLRQPLAERLSAVMRDFADAVDVWTPGEGLRLPDARIKSLTRIAPLDAPQETLPLAPQSPPLAANIPRSVVIVGGGAAPLPLWWWW